MDDRFVKAFRRYSFLKFTDLASLFKISTLKTYLKDEIIAREGVYCENAFLIRKGIIRTYLLDPEGREKTIRLSKEHDVTSCGLSFLQGENSNEYLHAVENCKVIAINTEKLQELSNDNIRILRLSHEGLKEAFLEAINRIEFFTTLTPEARYETLLKQSPELIQRVPQKYLASYIGVTTVSLSRIRNRNLLN